MIPRRRARRLTGGIAAAAMLLASCGGGGGGDGGQVTPTPTATPAPSAPTESLPAPALEALSAAEVGTIIAQAATEAQARGLPSTIAVVDRVGNVLGVFAMAGARGTAQVTPGPSGNLDIQGAVVPATLAAIAKAVTAAYLSSSGNAFTSRTASMIVQQHFPPAPTTVGLESGPLFGVQFSSLPCSDLVTRYGTGQATGPKRSPLGLSADPGSMPLYKNGVVVGGIGVMGDGAYGSDPDVIDIDDDAEEYAALAGSIGFEAPAEIRADRISVDGTLLRFSDAAPSRLRTTAGARFAAVSPALGALTAVRGYYAEGAPPALLAGQPYGSAVSGLRRSTTAEFDGDAFILVDGANMPRYPARGGTDGGEVGQPLTAAESRALLEEAFRVMRRARGQIRQPADSRAQVSISLVDTRGAILGVVRGADAPIFGTDVAVQKARTAAFLSGRAAAADLLAAPSSDVRDRVGMVRAFFGDPAALTGATAFSTRAIGTIARPYFPDGEVGRAPGPLSRPIAQFSPFSTGLQSALVAGNIAAHVGFVGEATADDTPPQCTALRDAAAGTADRLANGLQIFPGGVPIYRGSTLIGAIGVSGDGIDQDDMIASLGLRNAGARLGTIGHAPAAIRSDRTVVTLGDGRQVRLRYVNCPFAPFVGSDEQNVCGGI